jgi:hypothetical protein
MNRQMVEALTTVKTPLILAGLVILVLYFVYRSIVRQDTSRGRRVRSAVSPQIARYLFILSFVAISLGFLGWAIPPVQGPVSTPTPEPIVVFGKVHKMGDRKQGIASARVFLDEKVTKIRDADLNGNFAFRLDPSLLGQDVRVWAQADNYEVSADEAVLIQRDADKIFIGLSALATPHQVTTGEKQAHPRPRPQNEISSPPCSVGDAGLPPHAISSPAASAYGPDDNRPLDIRMAKRVVIRPGRTGSLTFSAAGPETENAVMVYDSAFRIPAERGTAPHRLYEPIEVRAPLTEPTIIIVSTWAKFGGMSGSWGPTINRVELASQNGAVWPIGAEDTGLASGNFRDMAVQVTCF